MAPVRYILDLWGKFWDDHNENLMIFITVQNLVAIALVVLEIQKSLNILHVWPEKAYSRLFWGCFGVKIRENGQFLNSYPSRNAITRN